MFGPYMKGFWNIARFRGAESRADQERIFAMSWVQNRRLVKHRARTSRQKELYHGGWEGWQIIYCGVGVSEEKGRF